MIEEIVAQMEAIVASADAENRSLSEDEVATYEGLEKTLAAAHKQTELRARHTAYTTPVSGLIAAVKPQDDTLERAFDNYLRTGQQSADLVELRAQSTTDAAGGYTVPDGFRMKLVERMKSFGGIQRVAEEIVTSTGASLEWPTVDDTANSGEIVAEGDTGAGGADIVFGTTTLSAFKYMSFGASHLPLKVSVELLQDSAFDIAGFVAKALGKRIARKQASDFAIGGGTTLPLGLMSQAAMGNLATAGTITYGELLDLVHAVDPDYRLNASFVMNDSTLKLVRQLVDGNQRPLWLPSTGGLADTLPGDGGSLLGYPVVIDQAIASIGDAAKIMAFGDIAEAYVIRRVKDVTLVVDPYSSAKNGQVEFTAWARADGTIQNPNAFAVLADKDVA